MNDRFKFRCYNRKTKKMYEVDSLHLDSENEWVWVHYYNPIYDKDLKIQIEQPNAIIMQSTGLKDKNGKLIYELDYIKYRNKTFKIKIDKFLGITLINILSGDIIVMDDVVLFNCEVISNEFECDTEI